MTPPPRLARWLVARLVRAPLADAVLGDLDELFADDARAGASNARRRYWCRALGAAWHLRGRHHRRAVVRGDSLMYTLWKDLAHGLRLFVAQPGYAWAAVVTLALAIGANTVIFSIANVLVVKPLPFADESRLGWILVSGPNAARDRAGVSLPEFANYFAVTGIPILAGRAFTAGDEAAAAATAVVSREAARRFWGDPAAAVGRQLRVVTPGAAAPLAVTVIGVSRDTANPQVVRAPDPMVLLLDAHRPTRDTYLVVRASAPGIGPALRAALRDVDGDLAFRLRTVPERFADENSSNALLAGLFAAFAVVALLLATAGLYGVVSYSVSQRTPEIAVRLALGASHGAIAREVVGGSLRLALAGAALGLGGALALARALTSLLFGVTATDAATYAGAALVAVVSALVATWLPMRRAAGVDPIQSLRQA